MIKKRSSHLITSRAKGDSTRIIIMVSFVILLIFSLCSIYALTFAPTNPAAWSMLIFFVFALVLLLTYEDNSFPDISKKKTPAAVITWFFAWVFVAFFVSFLMTMNMAHLVMAVFFGLILFFGSAYLFLNQAQWGNLKTGIKRNTGGRVKNAVKNSKTGQKISSRLKRRKTRRKRANKKRRISGW